MHREMAHADDEARATGNADLELPVRLVREECQRIDFHARDSGGRCGEGEEGSGEQTKARARPVPAASPSLEREELTST